MRYFVALIALLMAFYHPVGTLAQSFDSGTSTYERDSERLRQRGTAAHNTVQLGGVDSSEVWSGFRVGRRARPRAEIARIHRVLAREQPEFGPQRRGHADPGRARVGGCLQRGRPSDQRVALAWAAPYSFCTLTVSPSRMPSTSRTAAASCIVT